jgi:hypothetical protein
LMPNMPDKWLTLIMQEFETIIDEHSDFNDVYGYV